MVPGDGSLPARSGRRKWFDLRRWLGCQRWLITRHREAVLVNVGPLKWMGPGHQGVDEARRCCCYQSAVDAGVGEWCQVTVNVLLIVVSRFGIVAPLPSVVGDNGLVVRADSAARLSVPSPLAAVALLASSKVARWKFSLCRSGRSGWIRWWAF